MKDFGNLIRNKRLALFEEDKAYSLRQVSRRIGVEPSYLSKIERGLPVTLSEEKIVALAGELGLDTDYLLAMGGKISDDVQRIIKKRPELFARIVREMQRMPDAVIEEKTFFQSMAATLDRLHDLASIGAFRFPAGDEAAFWTDQVPKILGLAPDAVPSLEAIASGLDRESAERLVRVAGENLSGDGACRCEVRTRTEPPSTLLIWGCAEGDGPEATLLGIVQDVSDYAALRDEIRAAHDELRLQVDEQHTEIAASIRKLNEEIRRRHLLEINLQVVNRKIARQAKDQRRFFREHAFQLRSLMTRLGREPGPDPSGGGGLKPTIDRILPKIDDLGDFLSDPDSLAPIPSDTDVRRVLEDIRTAFDADAEDAGLSLITAASPALPALVRIDERRLRQMLTALMELFVTNTEWGAVQLSASTGPEPDGRLVLSVSAPSVKEPVTASLFSPGRGDQDAPLPTADPVRMVGPLARLLGGDPIVGNAPGTGATVVLSLPFEEAAQEPPAMPGDGETRTALIVEDAPYSRIFACRAMERNGFAVAEAANGAEAERLLRGRRYDVVLLDIQLPDITGTELAKALRADRESPNRDTPVVAVTAHADASDQEEFLRAGIDGIVTKPYEMEDLVAEAARLIADRSRP